MHCYRNITEHFIVAVPGPFFQIQWSFKCLHIIYFPELTCDAIEHSFPLEPLSSFDFWYVSFFQFFYILTGCSFSVSFDKSSSSFNSLNFGKPCTQSSDFYLFSLCSCLLSLFLLGKSLSIPRA